MPQPPPPEHMDSTPPEAVMVVMNSHLQAPAEKAAGTWNEGNDPQKR